VYLGTTVKSSHFSDGEDSTDAIPGWVVAMQSLAWSAPRHHPRANTVQRGEKSKI